MKASAIMTGSIKEVDKDVFRPKLLDFIDMIDGYGIALLLAGDEEKEVQQQYLLQNVSGTEVQTVLGKNYRINLFPDDTVEFNFSIRNLNFDKINEFEAKLGEMGFKHRTTYTSGWSGLTMKSIVEIDQDKDTEEVVSLMRMFKIE